ncbi:MAG: cobalamin B12-binding domain-containing protein [Holophagaceae bacterium]|nr:cobalamin B12-binding domain-containing protein [Holophagaceae bacterium]
MIPDTKWLSIGDICSETGLSPDVVRVWERRYGFPMPVRLPSGHRRYQSSDLNRLRLIAEAVADGHRPALAVKADEASLRKLLVRGQSSLWVSIIDPLIKAVVEMDSGQIRALLQDSFSRQPLKDFLGNVVDPLLAWVGFAWAEGSLGIHQEHLLTEILEDFLRQMRVAFPAQPSKGSILLTTLPGERHRLGMLMAALLYASKGVKVELLGIDLPVASIASAARTLQVDRVAVSLSIQSSGQPTRRLLMDLLERLPPNCRLLIGGQGAARTRKVEGVERMAGIGDI